MEVIQNYINGQLEDPSSGHWFDSVNPSTGKAFAKVPDSDSEDVSRAVKSAHAALDGWMNMPTSQRADILQRLADLIADNKELLARTESQDNGKPVSLAANVDIPRAEMNIRFFATSVIHFASESHAMENHAINYTLRKPIGIVGCISPWNLPLYLFTWKIAPALAAGNCVISKPSEVTPMTAWLFSKLCQQAGLPPGVLSIIHGYGHKVGAAIVEHPDIKAISFTGGTTTGAKIAAIAAPKFKKLSLELGGKNAGIIFEDCDFDKAVITSIQSCFANQGQICLCTSRLFIERGIYHRFKDAFLSKVKELHPGNPADPTTRFGAIVSKEQLEKVLFYVELAQQEGGRMLAGGKRLIMDGELQGGFFMEPTVIEGLSATCRSNQEEIFGPIVTLQPFDTEDEVVAHANCTQYGLAACIWTENLGRAHRIANRLQTGIVWVNCWLVRDLRTPFGGMKSSGVGREGGWEAIRFFTEPKNVCVSTI
eukprot:gene8307-10186_t